MVQKITNNELRELVFTINCALDESEFYRKLFEYFRWTPSNNVDVEYMLTIIRTNNNPRILSLIIDNCKNVRVQLEIAGLVIPSENNLEHKDFMAQLASQAVELSVILKILETTKLFEKENLLKSDIARLSSIARRLCEPVFQDDDRAHNLLIQEGLIDFLNIEHGLQISSGNLVLDGTKIRNSFLAGCLLTIYMKQFGQLDNSQNAGNTVNPLADRSSLIID